MTFPLPAKAGSLHVTFFMNEAGFDHIQTLAVEGPAWLSPYVEANWESDEKRQQILDLVGQIEAEPSLQGTSCQIMSIGRKV